MLTVGYSTREHKPEFIEYLKKSSGFKKINVIEKSMERDNFMSPQKALEFGIIDKVIEKRPEH